MNFDFLEDICQWRHVYENCNNAEKLAVSMPVQSVMTSRKSAELLAKFIYMAAHDKEMEGLTFAGVLSDITVRKFIRNREVMTAFHHIRKSGNQAVHGDNQENYEDAVAVLRDLHFVVGETACRLGLIDQYPSFEDRIHCYPDSKYIEMQDVEKKAREMFSDYLAKYKAQIQRDSYYEHRLDTLIAEITDCCSSIRFRPGDVDLNETIEFKNKPISQSTVKQIQEHFLFLCLQAIKGIQGILIDERKVEYSAELTVHGKNNYSTTDLIEVVNGIIHDLPNAEGFKIISKYSGPSIAPWFNNEIREEFRKTVNTIGELEAFTYTIYEFLYNHGQGYCEKYENGKKLDLKKRYSADIIDKDFGKEWWCWSMNLNVIFDFDKHPDILSALHDTVRECVPNNELVYSEEAWNEGDFGILCSSILWEPRKLRVIQNFLDKLNSILKPIMAECDTSGSECDWFITDAPFAIATLNWTERGFEIVGTEL